MSEPETAIDSSALIAILLNESDALRYSDAISASPLRLLSAPNFVEAAMVVHARQGDIGLMRLDRLIATSLIEIVPFTAAHAQVARDAYVAFGKGRHPAALNFGDCCAYALARSRGEPLLYKGTDFARTDVVAAG